MSGYRPVPTPVSNRDPIAAFDVARSRLHEAFASIPFDPQMVAIGVDEAAIAALAEPVRSLDASLLARFVLKVGTTWGGAEDLRRVAPRVLELAADHRLPLDRGLVWSKLSWADWTLWPSYQVATVREFARADWLRLLCSPPRPAHLAHRWLSDAVHGSFDIGGFLELWHGVLRGGHPDEYRRAAVGHLVVLLVHSPLRPDFPETVAAVLPGYREASTTLSTWLSSPTTHDLLEDMAPLFEGRVDERRVKTALARLQRFRSRVEEPPDGAGELSP